LIFTGQALDREDRDGNGFTWGITDGSFGLRGRVIDNGENNQELKMFAAMALRSMSPTAEQRQTTIGGEQVRTTVRNSVIAGSEAVLESYAKRILAEIEKNGSYIQVPAGKQFYVYPEQVIDADRADIPEKIATVE
jgi:hypothetical protein